MKEETGLRDYRGRLILEGDILSDNVPSKGIVMKVDGSFVVTSDYEGRDIRRFLSDESDTLTEDLVYYNRMVVVGNIHDNTKLVDLQSES